VRTPRNDPLSDEMRRVVAELRKPGVEIEASLWTSPSLVGPNGYVGRVLSGTVDALLRREVIERSRVFRRWRLVAAWKSGDPVSASILENAPGPQTESTE